MYLLCAGSRARAGKLRSNALVLMWSASQEWFSHFFLKWLEKNKRKIIVCATWKFCEVQMSISINKVLSEHSYTHSFTIVSGYFHAVIAEVKSCNKDHVAHRAEKY